MLSEKGKGLCGPMLEHYLRGIGGGICLGVGGTAVLSTDNSLFGMCIFFVALMSIYFFGYDLFTGKAGYIPVRPACYILNEVFPTWCGNFTGTVLLAQAMLRTAYGDSLKSRAALLVEAKCRGGAVSCVVLAALCGMLVYFAVDMYNRYREKDLTAALAYSFTCVIVFQSCHFEHSIADMFFFSMAREAGSRFPYLLLFSLGNLIGCACEPFCRKLAGRLRRPS